MKDARVSQTIHGERAIASIQEGVGTGAVARRLGCHPETDRSHREKFGWKRVTMHRQDQHIIWQHLQDRTLPDTRTNPTVRGPSGLISTDSVVVDYTMSTTVRRPYVEPILT